jgi:hypothetical protein
MTYPWNAGDILTAADLNAEFGSKLDVSSYEQPGLELVTAESFSAVSSVSVNGCFTTDYDVYKIVIDITAWPATTLGPLRMKLRASGSDNSSSAYSYGGRSVNGAVQAADFGEDNVTTGWRVGFIDTTGAASEFSQTDLTIFGPATSVKTKYNGLLAFSYLTRHGSQFFGGGHNVAAAYDGFSLLPASSTITGTLRVYGYRN